MPAATWRIVSRTIGVVLSLLVLSLLDSPSGGSGNLVQTASAACAGEACGSHKPRKGSGHEGGRRKDGHRNPVPGIGIIVTIPPVQVPPPQFEQPPPRQVAECGPGQTYSRKRGACVCRKGFEPSHGGCIPSTKVPPPPTKIADCGEGQFYSKSRKACVCRKGLVPAGHGCAKPIRVAECGPGELYSKNHKACVCRRGLVRLGGVCGRPPVIVVRPPVIVEKPPVVVIKEPKAPPPPPAPVAEKKPRPTQPVVEPANAPAREVKTVAAPPERRSCLPADLYDMLEQAYGRAPAVDRCEAACLAKPENVSEAQLADMSTRFGVEWCADCIKLGGWLPLADIERLEALTGATFCMTGGASFCSAPGYARVDPLVTKVKVIESIRQLPATLGKDGDIAVVIGNGAYENDIAAKPTAKSDADAVLTLLTDKLGYRKQNVIDVRDATLADMRRVFGGSDGVPGELGRLYDGKGDVFVYVSAQGLRDEAAGKSYLLPVDAKGADLAGTAYALDDLYTQLSLLGARTIMLALEASFPTSLAAFIDPPNLPEAEAGVLPETAVPGLAVFTASDRDQRPLDDPEFGTGLFTRYLIEGLAGKADAAPTGNDDRQLDSVELYVYTANMVRTAARKSLGLEQKPQLSKVDNLLIGKLATR